MAKKALVVSERIEEKERARGNWARKREKKGLEIRGKHREDEGEREKER